MSVSNKRSSLFPPGYVAVSELAEYTDRITWNIPQSVGYEAFEPQIHIRRAHALLNASNVSYLNVSSTYDEQTSVVPVGLGNGQAAAAKIKSKFVNSRLSPEDSELHGIRFHNKLGVDVNGVALEDYSSSDLKAGRQGVIEAKILNAESEIKKALLIQSLKTNVKPFATGSLLVILFGADAVMSRFGTGNIANIIRDIDAVTGGDYRKLAEYISAQTANSVLFNGMQRAFRGRIENKPEYKIGVSVFGYYSRIDRLAVSALIATLPLTRIARVGVSEEQDRQASSVV